MCDQHPDQETGTSLVPQDLPVFLPGHDPTPPKVPLSVLVDVSVFLFYPLRGHSVLALPLYEHTVVCLLQAPENNAAVSPCPFLWPRVQDIGWRVVGAFPLSFVAAPTLVNTLTSCLCFRALPALDSDEVEHVSLPSCFLP